MLRQRVLHVLFKLLGGFLQWRVHLHADDLFAEGRRCLGNVFERNERSQTHKEATKEEGGGSWSAANAFRYARLGARIVLGLNYGDLFEQPVSFREHPHAAFPKLKPFLHHPGRMHPEEDVEYFIRVASGKRSGEHHCVLRTSSQRAERSPLGGVSFQLVHPIRNGVVQEIRHASADEIHLSETSDFLSVRLPQRAVHLASRFGGLVTVLSA